MRRIWHCQTLVPRVPGHCFRVPRQYSGIASQRPALVLGAAQIVATHDLATNVDKIVKCIAAAGRNGVDLLAFAETATTGEL